MRGGRSSETSINELIKEGHAESPNGPKSIIIKAGNQFNGHVSNFTHKKK